jgi:AraC-like DNA-binding protein
MHEHVAPLAHHAEELVIRALRPVQPNFTQTVQHAVLHLLPTSQATLDTAAAALSMHPRTLQRRLDEEGYSFRELVNQARIQLAARMLSNPSVKIADIAEALGYSSTGAFSRWYAREFGEPPTQQREYRLQ